MRMQALLEKRQQEKPDWQDPKLLAELKVPKKANLSLDFQWEKGKEVKEFKKYGLKCANQINSSSAVEKDFLQLCSLEITVSTASAVEKYERLLLDNLISKNPVL